MIEYIILKTRNMTKTLCTLINKLFISNGTIIAFLLVQFEDTINSISVQNNESRSHPNEATKSYSVLSYNWIGPTEKVIDMKNLSSHKEVMAAWNWKHYPWWNTRLKAKLRWQKAIVDDAFIRILSGEYWL